MSKWVWCGVAGLVAIAGSLVGTRYFAARQVEVASAEPSRPAPLDTPNGIGARVDTPTDVAPLPAPLRAVEQFDEPIVMQVETRESEPGELTSTLASAGLKEIDAAHASAPHPDPELRRMPYADGASPRPKESFLSWIGLFEWLNDTTSQINTAEESAEPPMLESPIPAYHHPQHCPYHGHCPYPYSTSRSIR